ncbi:hypothetical protein ACHAQH_001797 [Verticillium albo-atrum]
MRVFTLFFLPSLVFATEALDKAKITISKASHSGSGCPQGTVTSVVSAHLALQVITFGFDQFQTYIGPGASYTERSKNCQLHLNLQYPAGFSFAVVDSVYHGFALLDPGVTGNFFSTYYFSADAAKTSTTQTSIRGGGPWANGQVYTKQDFVPAGEIVRSPCGGSQATLNVNNRIALNSDKPEAFGMITNDDATVSLQQQVHIEWYKC